MFNSSVTADCGSHCSMVPREYWSFSFSFDSRIWLAASWRRRAAWGLSARPALAA